MSIGMVTLVSLIAFESVAVTTAMPTVARSLDGLSLYALAFGGVLAAGVVGMVVSGGWSDARGPAAPTWTGVALFCVGLLLAGAAHEMWLVVAGRVVQGFGGGLVTVALYVVVGRAYPARLHPRVFSAFAGAWVVPSIVGPSVAGLVVERFGWRWVFLAVVALAIPAVLLIRTGLRSLGPAGAGAAGVDTAGAGGADAGRFTRAGWAVGAAVSVGLLHFGGQRSGASALALLVVGLVGLALSAPRLMPAGTFAARRGLPSVVLLRGLAGAAFLQAEVFIPLMLTRERDFSPSAAGLTLTVGGLSWFLGSWYQGRWGQRVPPERRLAAGLALITVGVGSAAVVVAPAVPVAVVVVGWAFAGLGMGVSFPSMAALILRLSPPGERGVNSSALQISDSLLSTTVLAIGGTAFAAFVATSAPTAYLTGYLVGMVLALVGVWVAYRTRVPAAAPAVLEPV